MKRPRSIEAHFAWLATLIAAGSIAVIVAGMMVYFAILDHIVISDLTPAVQRLLDQASANPNLSSRQIDDLYRRYVYTPPEYQPLLVVCALAAAALIGAIWMSRRAGRRFARPVSAVVSTARELAAGHLDSRVQYLAEAGTAAELDQLVADIDLLGERLQAAEARMREDAASLAHELRTPLAALKGRIQAMIDGVFPMTAEECERLMPPIERLTLLVEDLRTLSLARGKRLTLRSTPTDIALLVQDMIEELKPLWTARSATIDMRLTPVTAEIDAFRIRQVVANLIDNALRYGGARPELRLETRRIDDRAEILVADSGPGWPISEQSTLLDPFVRGEASRARDSGGSGLGLAVVDALVRAHGGTVELVNGKERGAVVRLLLPLAEDKTGCKLR